MVKWFYYRFIYRRFMKIAHHHNWHHMKPCFIEKGETLLWCHWCGIRIIKNEEKKVIDLNRFLQ